MDITKVLSQQWWILISSGEKQVQICQRHGLFNTNMYTICKLCYLLKWFPRVGTIKVRNNRNLTEAEDVKKRWQEYTEELYKKYHNDPEIMMVWSLTRTRHPGMWSQVGLRNITTNKACGGDGLSWAISNPKRWCCESAALNMPANLENSAVATGQEKVSFHFNPWERQCQRMLKLPHNCTHLTR